MNLFVAKEIDGDQVELYFGRPSEPEGKEGPYSWDYHSGGCLDVEEVRGKTAKATFDHIPDFPDLAEYRVEYVRTIAAKTRAEKIEEAARGLLDSHGRWKPPSGEFASMMHALRKALEPES